MAKCGVSIPVFGACPNKVAAADMLTMTLDVVGNTLTVRLPVCRTHVPLLIEFWPEAKIVNVVKESK
jgi:hypothetical protein